MKPEPGDLGAPDAATPPAQIQHLDPLLPAQMAERAEAIGATKAGLPLLNLAALAVLAGAFIALGAAFFTTVTTSTELGYGPTRLIGGLAISVGLFRVVVGGV